MPYTPISGDIIQITLQAATLAGQRQLGLITLHYKADPPVGGGTSLVDLAFTLGAVFPAPLKAIMSAQASYLGLLAQKVFPLPVSIASFDNSATGVGGVAGDMLPKQTAAVVTKLTDFGGRSFRGRAYTPFPGEADSDTNGVPTGGFLARLQTFANTLLVLVNPSAGPASTLYRPGLFHRATGTFTVLSAVRANQRWGTQRRRGDYGQANPR